MKKRGSSRKGDLNLSNLNETKDQENELLFVEEETADNEDDEGETEDQMIVTDQDESKSGKLFCHCCHLLKN